MYKPRVYTASKLHHYAKWMLLREDPSWDFIHWTASWPDKLAAGLEETSTPAQFAQHWVQDVKEVKDSDFLLIQYDDGLRGALVEAGVALAEGIRIVAIHCPSGDTWTNHPLVTRVYDLEKAKNFLYQYTAMVPPASRKRLKDDEDAA